VNHRMALLVMLFVSATAARGEEGCTKDNDCKGERICVRRLCVAPPGQAALPPPVPAALPPPVPAGDAAPAAYRDPVTPGPVTEPPTLAATPMGPSDTRHRHLGAFIRPDLGLGYLITSASQGGVDANLRGLAGTFGFAAGGALSEDSILAFHVWDAVVSDPTYSGGGSSGTTSGTLALYGFGPEYTMYSKENYYFSISPSLTRMSASSSSGSSATNWGLGLRAAVGREWWTGDHWGLGVGGHLSMSLNQDSGSNGPIWTTWAFTVAFSATYN
jgi:hypothetical protein